MTSRSIVLSTAALLLMTAATPLQFGLSPTAAFAQEVSAEVTAALTGDPAGLDAAELRERITLLREAVKSGAIPRADRKAVQEKIKAYRDALQQLRAERREARQETEEADDAGQAETAEQGEAPGQAETGQQRAERAQQDNAERRAERQAQRAERQARRAERQAEQAEEQQPAQQQTQQPAQQQAQAEAPAAGLTPEMSAAIDDTRPAAELDPAELRSRIQTLRSAVQSGALSRAQRREVQARMQADREVLRSRRAERTQESEPAETTEQQPRRQQASEAPAAEVEERAQAIIADDTPATRLDDQALRKRLTENRAILGTGRLSRSEERQLRQQLREDREELRGRVAARQDEAEEEEDDDEPASTTEVTQTTNVNVIIEQRTPADRLSESDLERRVRALNRALREERIARRDAEIAREIIEQDRRELRRRLQAERERRRDRRREARARNEVFIDFNIGVRPPPVIFAAEAMPRDIEVQLVAPPTRRVSRAYSVQEIAANPEVRETMPGIEIDTLNFDFGSAEVRPEEIDKLDAIAEVIERIVAARPDEVFLIEGHTDAVGTDAANDALSQRRSQAVAEALLDYYAIDPENLQTVGLGERYLKVWTEEPEEENRRVTIRRITPLLAGGQG